MVMRRQASHVWMMSVTLAFVLVLALGWQHRVDHHAGSMMSAPSAPRTTIESRALNTVVRDHFDPSALLQLWTGLPSTPVVFGCGEYAGRLASFATEYSPLNRRPPPANS